MTVSLKDFVQVRKVMAEPFAFGTQVAPVLVVRRNEQRDFFDDLDAVAPHRVQLSRVVGQQPHRAYAQILQDLSGPKVRLGEFAPFVLKRDFSPNFPLRLMHKDIGLALDLAKQMNVELPAGTAVLEVYTSVLNAAKEDVDFAAVGRYWEK